MRATATVANAVAATNVLSVKSSYAGPDGFRTGLTYEDGLTGNVSQKLQMSFTPDSLRRLSRVDWDRTPSAPNMQVLASYTWRGASRLSRTVNYGGATTQATGVTTFDYDDLGRLTKIADNVTPTGSSTATETNKFEYAYDFANNLKKEKYAKVGGRTGDRFTYDAYHRLKEAYMGVDATTVDLAPNVDPTGYSSAVANKKEAFTLDAAQNRDMVVVNQGATTQSFDYDIESSTNGFLPSNRYVTAHGATVAHDQRGNLAYDGQFYFRYDFQNRLQEVWQVVPTDTTQAPATDEKFAVVQDVEALDDSRKEVYDEVLNLLHRVPQEHTNQVFRDRLKRTISGGVIRLLGGGGGGMLQLTVPANLELKALYGYDAYNRRVLRVVVGEETWLYTYDGWREVVEHKLNFTANRAEPVKQFVHGSRLDEIVSYRRRVDDPVSGPVWESYYVQHGGQDTAAKLVDANGNIVEKYECDAYGRATCYKQVAGTWTAFATSQFESSHLWKGARLDKETGLLYMRNRYYSVTMGRFVTPDPVGAWVDGCNLGNEYTYGGNAPYSGADPLGLLLVAIDGTRSRPDQWRDEATGLYNSHTRNFFNEYVLQKGETGAAYFHGPDKVLGGDAKAILDGAKNYIVGELCKNPNQPINIVGHSRGGLIAIELAQWLKTLTLCGRTGFGVNFLGLLDPVDNARELGEIDGGRIPGNVRNALAVFRDVRLGSRRIFNTMDAGIEDGALTNYYAVDILGTHAAIGGAPWEGDHIDRWPTGRGPSLRFHTHDAEKDILASDRAWALLQLSAIEAGVGLDPSGLRRQPGGSWWMATSDRRVAN